MPGEQLEQALREARACHDLVLRSEDAVRQAERLALEWLRTTRPEQISREDAREHAGLLQAAWAVRESYQQDLATTMARWSSVGIAITLEQLKGG